MAVLKITWHTVLDERTCPICRPLNLKTWSYNTNTEQFPTVLTDTKTGIVWDAVEDEPRTHGQDINECRCGLKWKFDTSEIINKILELTGKVEKWKNMGDVLVLREAGRFVAWRRIT